MSSEPSAPRPGQLLVLSAPSGAGKTTLAHRFVESESAALFSISVTTRAPRGTERDGVDYHFVSRDRFEGLVAKGELAEWAEVHGQRYGTLRATVQAALDEGRVAVFDIDVQGGAQLKAAFPAEATTVFVLPPDAPELERRLRGRSTEGEVAIARRLAAARDEVRRGLSSYDYVVVNDEIEAALAQIVAIVLARRARLGGRIDAAAEHIAASCRRGVARIGDWAAFGVG
jgi:guanylate kinase